MGPLRGSWDRPRDRKTGFRVYIVFLGRLGQQKKHRPHIVYSAFGPGCIFCRVFHQLPYMYCLLRLGPTTSKALSLLYVYWDRFVFLLTGDDRQRLYVHYLS